MAETEKAQSELEILMQIEKNPRQAKELCSKLKNAVAKKRCLAIQMRPHLWYKQTAQKADKRRSSGPSGRFLAPSVPTPFAPNPSKTICESSWTESACRESEAIAADNLTGAMGACANLNDLAWKEECFFVAAEKRLVKFGAAKYDESVELCLQAKRYKANCFNHLAKAIAEKANSAISDNARTWSDLIWSTKQVHTYWTDKDPLFGAAAVDLIWAHATDISYEHSGVVAGNPLDYLPVEAKPHVYAAATYHTMKSESVEKFDLAGWTTQIITVLNSRLKPHQGQAKTPFRRKTISTDWSTDSLGDDNIPAVYYMTDGRRATSEDKETDIAICILEAAARLPNGQSLLFKSKLDDRPLVKWTANRLLGNTPSSPEQRPR